MKKSILGIDLGTSSLKLLKWSMVDGFIQKRREVYAANNPAGWKMAFLKAARRMDLGDVVAIGLSSQVGTYVVNRDRVISWKDSIGAEELKIIKAEIPKERFLKEISMPHPDIISYPMPRIRYCMEHYQELESICQPKDILCEFLTGNLRTDCYSWRGLVNLEKKAYSEWALEYLGIRPSILPEIGSPVEVAGGLLLEDVGMRKGTPVYIGCNDFFASLIGMGLDKELFDITGTSEHIGGLTKHLVTNTNMVSGPYLRDYVHYGVTASCGASMEFGTSMFGAEVDIEKCLKKNPPVFLPYLNGERAPIWDEKASGVFFGIRGDCGKEEMAYAVMEGIVFSIYHVFESLDLSDRDSMLVTGGAALSHTMNILKAELFQVNVKTLEENDTSALGAVMMAAVGHDVAANLQAAARSMCRVQEITVPTGRYREALLKRFALYKRFYPCVKDLLHEKQNLEVVL